nr:hypothetical protein [Mucilaginibacter sp. L294]
MKFYFIHRKRLCFILSLILAFCFLSSFKPLRNDTIYKAKATTQGQVIIIKEPEESNKFEGFNEVLQTLSFIAVVVTLLYLAKQNRLAANNTILGSFQHVYNHLNDFNLAVNQSNDLATVIIKGRQSYSELLPHEKLRFEHTYGWLANILEGWLMLIEESRMSGHFKETQIANIKSIILFYFSHPGLYEFWPSYESMYTPEICKMINDVLNQFDQPLQPEQSEQLGES